MDPQKRLLDDVFGVLLVASHSIRDTEEHSPMPVHQHPERISVPGPHVRYQSAVGHWHQYLDAARCGTLGSRAENAAPCLGGGRKRQLRGPLAADC